jgi:O-antigen ligase
MQNVVSSNPRASWLDRQRLSRIADGLVVAIAVSLPWSTSATGILVVLWLLALLPTCEPGEIRRELATPAGALPVLLVALGVVGMLWADVGLVERFKGLDSFFKLLAIPLLLVQFRRSDRGLWVFGGYLAACAVVLVLSAIIYAWPALWWPRADYGVPAKNAATQSGEFVTCIFGLLYLAIEFFERRRWRWLLASLALAFGMLANIFYVATGRTALAIIPVLLAILAAKKLRGRSIFILFAGAILVGCIGWISSPYLRDRMTAVLTEVQKYEATVDRNSSGERIEFWKKSAEFVAEAPIFGHGTGSIPSLFMKSAVGQIGAAASATTNPHNQTFAVAIQLGLVGAAVLWAMWIAHLLLFRGTGLAEWIGLAVVVQTIVGSLFNSHLFDFTQGWLYVFGVGVAGGMTLKRRTAETVAGIAARSP